MQARIVSANRYDAIVLGARCAGAPTAMQLARKGWRVEARAAVNGNAEATRHLYFAREGLLA